MIVEKTVIVELGESRPWYFNIFSFYFFGVKYVRGVTAVERENCKRKKKTERERERERKKERERENNENLIVEDLQNRKKAIKK